MIENAAREPEVVDLAVVPERDGRADRRARAPTSSRSKASSACTARSYAVMPDRIETGTFLVAAAATGGERAAARRAPGHPRRGARQAARGGRARRRPGRTGSGCAANGALNAVNVRTAPYPGVSHRHAGAVHGARQPSRAAPRIITETDLREPLHARAGAEAPRRRHRGRGQHRGGEGRGAPRRRDRDGDRSARLGEPGARRARRARHDRRWTASTTSTAATSGSRRSSRGSARASARALSRSVTGRPNPCVFAYESPRSSAAILTGLPTVITIALSKGRIFDETVPLLKARASSRATIRRPRAS